MNNKHIALLLAKGKSKKPVEDTVRRCWADIMVAAANGHSRADIAKSLQADGHDVGKTSGFNAALARVAKERGIVLDDLGRRAIYLREGEANDARRPADTDAACEPPPLGNESREGSPSTDSGVRAGSSGPTTSPFADTRFPSKF